MIDLTDLTDLTVLAALLAAGLTAGALAGLTHDSTGRWWMGALVLGALLTGGWALLLVVAGMGS